MIGIAFRKALSFFLDLYRCDSRSWALNCWSSVSGSRPNSTELQQIRQGRGKKHEGGTREVKQYVKKDVLQHKPYSVSSGLPISQLIL